jgi:hypothetical protein
LAHKKENEILTPAYTSSVEISECPVQLLETDSFERLCRYQGDTKCKTVICDMRMRISRQLFPVKHMIDRKQLENVESFKYLGSKLTNHGRCTCEMKSRIVMAKDAFVKKRAIFTSKMYLELRKKPVKYYIWSVALYGAETWTLRAVDQKHLESLEMWCWRRM